METISAGFLMSTTQLPREYPVTRYKIHQHVVLIHFPGSFLVASAGMMFLHLVTRNDCFKLGSYATLIGGAIAMVPATATGWSTWKGSYKGLSSRLFLNMIRISFAMIGISFLLVIYHNVITVMSLDVMSSIRHSTYFASNVLW